MAIDQDGPLLIEKKVALDLSRWLLDAITAHLTTNLPLGLYVLLGGQWCYW